MEIQNAVDQTTIPDILAKSQNGTSHNANAIEIEQTNDISKDESNTCDDNVVNIDKTNNNDELQVIELDKNGQIRAVKEDAETYVPLRHFEPPFTSPLAPFSKETPDKSKKDVKKTDTYANFIKLERKPTNGQIDAEFVNSDGMNLAESCESEKLIGNNHTHNSIESAASTVLLNDNWDQHHTYCSHHHRDCTMNDIKLKPMDGTLSSCPREFLQTPQLNLSLFFDDGKRSIDFVLAHKHNEDDEIEMDHQKKRENFQQNLIRQGLQIEEAYKEKEDIYFVKIHAPLEVLTRYAEILKLRMPMKEPPGLSTLPNQTHKLYARLKGGVSNALNKMYVDERYFPKKTHHFTAIFSRNKEYLFDIRRDCFFTSAVRSRIVQFILDRARFVDTSIDEMGFGIERLVTADIYCSAYPLHDGEITEKSTTREVLYNQWASISKWYRYQPLDYIKEYFGVKIGLYFAWLGYYTYMLMWASVGALLCLIYSLSTLKYHQPVKDICDRESQLNITMCPLCDICNFWNLKETCFLAKISYIIDNPSTVIFAFLMSFWAALFLEFWKRYSAEITHRWDLTGFDIHEEHPRPEYLARLRKYPKLKTKTDYVTDLKEPQVPFWRMKLPGTILSFSVVLLLILGAFAALIAIVIYRMSMLYVFKVNSVAVKTTGVIMLANISAAFINLVVLFALNSIYNKLAEYLTELELWRTQTQFDDSLTLKIYLLQFVNYYASIFYIAFFKGKFTGHPAKYNTIFEYRQEECSMGGCLIELFIQMVIIMIGKQFFNAIVEVLSPMIWRKVRNIQAGLSAFFKYKDQGSIKHRDERWLRDLKLLDWGPRNLFPEYLEMVLQYGFVTIFIAAFPLAPICALLNNIFEMRLDAKKLLTQHKRPVSQRVRDIGVWYRILDCISKLSVITNGFIIAFTSDFIPRLVYRLRVSKDHSLNGYVDFTLSHFKVTDSENLRSLVGDNGTISTCRYSDYREPPESEHPYELSTIYYEILAYRLGFVVLFENFVALAMILVRWCIPDMSVELRDQIRREIYLTNEVIIQHETERALKKRANCDASEKVAEIQQEPNSLFIEQEQSMMERMDDFLLGDDMQSSIADDEVP